MHDLCSYAELSTCVPEPSLGFVLIHDQLRSMQYSQPLVFASRQSLHTVARRIFELLR
jgi:hypothetical protein